MYKIKVRNDNTGAIWWEYGFTHYIMKRIHFLFNEVDENFYHKYNIIEIVPIIFTLKTFRKCLTKYIDMI